MPTTREVEAARVERMRRATEAQQAAPGKPKTALDRRLARIAEAHARATAAVRWSCHVDACPDPGPHPAANKVEGERAAMRHYNERHYTPDPPADLEQQRAAWVAAGRPPLGATP